MRISDWSSDVCSSDLSPPLCCNDHVQRRVVVVLRPIVFPRPGVVVALALGNRPFGHVEIAGMPTLLVGEPSRDQLLLGQQLVDHVPHLLFAERLEYRWELPGARRGPLGGWLG